MATSREVRYLSPNDIGKMVTYSTPSVPGKPESDPVLLGGTLMGIETETTILSHQTVCSPETLEEPWLRTVILDLSGHQVRLVPSQSVTVYGTDGR